MLSSLIKHIQHTQHNQHNFLKPIAHGLYQRWAQDYLRMGEFTLYKSKYEENIFL